MVGQEIEQKVRMLKNKFMQRMNLILTESGLTRMEFEILNFIYYANKNEEEVMASSLAKYFEVSIPAVMHKLESLEDRGLIHKKLASDDKRIKYYRLSETTRMKYEELFAERNKRNQRFLETLGEEQEHLIKILDISLKFLEDEYDTIIKMPR